MVRKIATTSGGWRKRFSAADDHHEFEQAASRALAAFAANTITWRDTAIRKLTDPLKRRPLATTMITAFSTFARELVELETPVLPEATTGPREPIDAVPHRRWLRDMLTYKDHAEELFTADQESESVLVADVHDAGAALRRLRDLLVLERTEHRDRPGVRDDRSGCVRLDREEPRHVLRWLRPDVVGERATRRQKTAPPFSGTVK